MAITASMVKELREMTGAGMMDCKKALTATDGDMEKAVEFLREKGLAAAAKKANRIAAEGIVDALVAEDGKKAVLVEVNAETDFVAKNQEFRDFVGRVAAQLLASDVQTIEEYMAMPWIDDETETVEQALSRKIAIIGEKLSIRRFVKVDNENGVIVPYIHGGGKIGVLVNLTTEAAEAAKECAKNLAMQVAALYPKYVDRSQVDQEYIEKETEILKAAALNEKPDAPEKVLEGMVKGRLNKELKEICLVDQIYVKAEDGKQTVAAYVKEVAGQIGAPIDIAGFVRLETGEGIEKKEENFAEEVAKQMQM